MFHVKQFFAKFNIWTFTAICFALWLVAIILYIVYPVEAKFVAPPNNDNYIGATWETPTGRVFQSINYSGLGLWKREQYDTYGKHDVMTPGFLSPDDKHDWYVSYDGGATFPDTFNISNPGVANNLIVYADLMPTYSGYTRFSISRDTWVNSAPIMEYASDTEAWKHYYFFVSLVDADADHFPYHYYCVRTNNNFYVTAHEGYGYTWRTTGMTYVYGFNTDTNAWEYVNYYYDGVDSSWGVSEPIKNGGYIDLLLRGDDIIFDHYIAYVPDGDIFQLENPYDDITWAYLSVVSTKFLLSDGNDEPLTPTPTATPTPTPDPDEPMAVFIISVTGEYNYGGGWANPNDSWYVYEIYGTDFGIPFHIPDNEYFDFATSDMTLASQSWVHPVFAIPIAGQTSAQGALNFCFTASSVTKVKQASVTAYKDYVTVANYRDYVTPSDYIYPPAYSYQTNNMWNKRYNASSSPLTGGYGTGVYQRRLFNSYYIDGSSTSGFYQILDFAGSVTIDLKGTSFNYKLIPFSTTYTGSSYASDFPSFYSNGFLGAFAPDGTNYAEPSIDLLSYYAYRVAVDEFVPTPTPEPIITSTPTPTPITIQVVTPAPTGPTPTNIPWNGTDSGGGSGGGGSGGGSGNGGTGLNPGIDGYIDGNGVSNVLDDTAGIIEGQRGGFGLLAFAFGLLPLTVQKICWLLVFVFIIIAVVKLLLHYGGG